MVKQSCIIFFLNFCIIVVQVPVSPDIKELLTELISILSFIKHVKYLFSSVFVYGITFYDCLPVQFDII